VKAPSHGRMKTRLSWIGRQLRGTKVSGDATVAVTWDHRGLRSFGTAAAVKEDASVLMREPDGSHVPTTALPRLFEIESTAALVKGRGRSNAPVLEGVSNGLEEFYRGVVEHLRAYVPPAPKLADRSGEAPGSEVPLSSEPTIVASTAEMPVVQPSEPPGPGSTTADQPSDGDGAR